MNENLKSSQNSPAHILVAGSLAFDTLMTTTDSFERSSVGSSSQGLNMVININSVRSEFGGCGGNIAYNLKLLGAQPLLIAAVGRDFNEYADHLRCCNINLDGVHIFEQLLTARATIITDANNNQITAFHPGAMAHDYTPTMPHSWKSDIAIVAPDGKKTMLRRSLGFKEMGIRTLLDPGQGLALFNRNELDGMIDCADWLVLNHHESQLLEQIIGVPATSLVNRLRAVIITHGAHGSDFHLPEGVFHQPIYSSDARDPTGCGDAFRAGLLVGIQKQCSWQETAKMASLCGAIAAEHEGTQNHNWDMDAFARRLLSEHPHPS